MYILHPEGSLHPLYTEGIYILHRSLHLCSIWDNCKVYHTGRSACMCNSYIYIETGRNAYNVIGILV